MLVEKRQVGREEFLDILLAHDPSHDILRVQGRDSRLPMGRVSYSTRRIA